MRNNILFLFIFFAGTSVAQQTSRAEDSTQIRNTVMSFYTWYNDNYQKLMNYQLYEGIKTNNQPPYRINWPQAEQYFQFILSTVPQLGEDYINKLRQHFINADSAFKKDVDSEIPFGFDYDWFTNSQEEPSYLLDELKKSGEWIISINGETASVSIPSSSDDPGMKKFPVYCAT